MISKKPKATEAQFLRGASRAARPESNGIKRLPFRLPEELADRLKHRAWEKKVSVNALMIAILEKALK